MNRQEGKGCATAAAWAVAAPGFFAVLAAAVVVSGPLGVTLGPAWGPAAACLVIACGAGAVVLAAVFARRPFLTEAGRGQHSGARGAGPSALDREPQGDSQTEALSAEEDALARLLGYLAGRDGAVSARTRTAAGTAHDLLGGDADLTGRFLAAFDAGAASTAAEEPALQQWVRVLARWCEDEPDRGADLFTAACLVAAADGHVTGGELEVLRLLNDRLCGGRCDPAGFAENTNADSPYAVLGLTPPCSREEVRRAYRRKAAEYHPDRLARQDVPDELRFFGERRFKTVNDAYERIAADWR